MESICAQETARAFVDAFNEAYSARHWAFEEQFWGTKMNLKDPKFTAEALASTKQALEELLSDEQVIATAKRFAGSLEGSSDEEDTRKVLAVILKTCQDLPEDAKSVRSETNQLEAKLELARNSMTLGYTVDRTFTEASSVALRNLLRTSDREAVRKAAYEGLRSIGPFVCGNGFCEIVKLRNRLAKQLGFEDYYDYTVTSAEGFGKARLFEILDTLEVGTRPLHERAREELARKHGADAVHPWNTSFCMAGSVIAKMDPYFPFGKAVESYMRSYSNLGISYQGATLNLDLLDREKKYSNGFCHWPVCAWVKPDGSFQASTANFTSLADPQAVGSGLTALATLMHEAGHAAHFANIQQPSPLFSQERPPTSVAYAENQSMFLDSLTKDSAWRAKYAKNAAGEPIPFEIIEEEIRATHPFAVFQLRAMLAVSYFEKALYELPDDRVTPETLIRLADDTETRIQGGPSPRPLLSIPHLISDEASCYYQGYTLAEMSVYQTREFFLQEHGSIVDNPKVGPVLTDAYWKCGNSEAFLDLVKGLTGKDLTGDAWTHHLEESVEDKVARERKEYEASLAQASKEIDESILKMTVRFVDGDEVIADSSSDGGLLGACSRFEEFVSARRETAAA